MDIFCIKLYTQINQFIKLLVIVILLSTLCLYTHATNFYKKKCKIARKSLKTILRLKIKKIKLYKRSTIYDSEFFKLILINCRLKIYFFSINFLSIHFFQLRSQSGFIFQKTFYELIFSFSTLFHISEPFFGTKFS